MNKKKTSNYTALDRLADALVEDILSASDQDILNEVRDDQGDPAAIAERARGLFDTAVAGAVCFGVDDDGNSFQDATD